MAWMFQPALGTAAGENGRYDEFEPPQPDATYAHGADWAREHDWTVIETVRIDVRPYRVVAFERLQRQPWPQMIKRLDDRMDRYGGSAVHDGTGLGNVIASLLTQPAEAFYLIARPRQELLAEYIKAVEEGLFDAPVIAPTFHETQIRQLSRRVWQRAPAGYHLRDGVGLPGGGRTGARDGNARVCAAAGRRGRSTSEPSPTPATDSNPWLACVPTREFPG